MITDKIKQAASFLKAEPDLSKVEKYKELIGIVHEHKISAFPIAHTTIAPMGSEHLLITPHPEVAVALSAQNSCPVWLYDQIRDIKHMNLSSQNGPPWILLNCMKEDIDAANMLADRWTYGPYEVTVMKGSSDQVLNAFSGGLIKPEA